MTLTVLNWQKKKEKEEKQRNKPSLHKAQRDIDDGL